MAGEKDLTMFAQPAQGYTNWKKALSSSGFAKHVGDRNPKHRIAKLSLNSWSTSQDVAVVLRHHSSIKMQQNRRRVTTIWIFAYFLHDKDCNFEVNTKRYVHLEVDKVQTEHR
ncbi:hypothetical protein PC116_g5831 [Phytophthora cactorum]|nr:hypothetical protein PC114_g24784 [Phytophthora cactorum]KAG4246356.1 hypothetical protein PC116_g5831 [Phytophthora cactorum]